MLTQSEAGPDELEAKLASIADEPVNWRKYSGPGLDVDYVRLLPPSVADSLLRALERNIEYMPAEKAKVRVFGKWHQVPRQQAAFGDSGLTYTFSGLRVDAEKWPEVLLPVRNLLKKLIGVHFNFVLINRYRSGDDYMGEHRDDEGELVPTAPIAALTLGAVRTLVFRHGDTRSGRKRTTAGENIPLPSKIEPVRLDLEHGSLLMMNTPTNRFWYHSVPRRRNKPGVRVSLTFRQIDPTLAAAAARRSHKN